MSPEVPSTSPGQAPSTSSAQVLYRKWRPQTFGEVVGQEPVTRTFRNPVASGRIAHAYLLRGPRGTGTTSPAPGAAPDVAGESLAAGLRLSYFFAWFIVFMLIIVIARIAMTAISTGGRLVLHDTEVRRFARALIEETRGQKR